MRAVQILVTVLMVVFFVGCEEKTAEVAVPNADSLQSEIEAAQQEIEQLKQEIAAMQKELDALQVEKKHYTVISHLSAQFVEAHVAGDKRALEELLAYHVKLEEKEGELLVSYLYAGVEVEWSVYRAESPYVYQGMVLQGFGYNPDTGMYMVHIQEFYTDQAGEPVSPPTFLNLAFQQIAGEWKVIEVTFDV